MAPTAATRDAEAQVFETGSGLEIQELYGPDDVPALDPDRDLGHPGEYPFVRGPYAGMYRTRIWTRRFQVGFGSPVETHTIRRFDETSHSTSIDRAHRQLDDRQAGRRLTMGMEDAHWNWRR